MYNSAGFKGYILICIQGNRGRENEVLNKVWILFNVTLGNLGFVSILHIRPGSRNRYYIDEKECTNNKHPLIVPVEIRQK
jgi:hypothetical protein